MTILFIPNHCQAHFAKGSEEKLYSYLYSRIPLRSNNHLLSLLPTSFYCIHCLKNWFSKYKIVQLLAFAFLKQAFWLIQYNRNISWASVSFLAQEKIKPFQKKRVWIQSDRRATGSDFHGEVAGGSRAPSHSTPTPSAAPRLGKGNGLGIWKRKAPMLTCHLRFLQRSPSHHGLRADQAEAKRQLYSASCLPSKCKTTAGLSRSLGRVQREEVCGLSGALWSEQGDPRWGYQRASWDRKADGSTEVSGGAWMNSRRRKSSLLTSAGARCGSRTASNQMHAPPPCHGAP